VSAAAFVRSAASASTVAPASTAASASIVASTSSVASTRADAVVATRPALRIVAGDRGVRGALVAGEGEPVVMLHASLSAKSQWQPLLDTLAPNWLAIALDLHGYGDNALEPKERAHTVDDEAELVAGRIDRIAGAEARVHLVGHSYGGLTALRYALRHPQRVASLTLFEPVVFRLLNENDPTLADCYRVAAMTGTLARAGCLHDVAESVVDFWSGKGAFAAMPARTRDAIARCSPKMPLDFEAAWGYRPDEAALRALDVPTLLLAGRRGPPLTARIVARLSSLLLDARVASFDCGHMGPLTDPAIVNPAIVAFLERNRAA